MDRPLDALPDGTKLAGYVIGPVLCRGSFGVTYLAADDLFPDRKFAIKEFLPGGIAVRRPGEASVRFSPADPHLLHCDRTRAVQHGRRGVFGP